MEAAVKIERPSPKIPRRGTPLITPKTPRPFLAAAAAGSSSFQPAHPPISSVISTANYGLQLPDSSSIGPPRHAIWCIKAARGRAHESVDVPQCRVAVAAVHAVAVAEHRQRRERVELCVCAIRRRNVDRVRSIKLLLGFLAEPVGVRGDGEGRGDLSARGRVYGIVREVSANTLSYTVRLKPRTSPFCRHD